MLKKDQPDYENVFPIVTKDISERGLSFIHAGEITTNKVIVGFEGPVGLSFLSCSVEHITSLGYGFQQSASSQLNWFISIRQS
ncbi:MAG: hypothetical protein CMJ78_25175 [Planctomycetaceae bacterium]|nr:hypothetical protein [Planctomycetaceae bacterium]